MTPREARIALLSMEFGDYSLYDVIRGLNGLDVTDEEKWNGLYMLINRLGRQPENTLNKAFELIQAGAAKPYAIQIESADA
jgi:hypothetical protein